MIRICLLALVALALPGCATKAAIDTVGEVVEAESPDQRREILDTIRADLQEALRSAEFHEDPIAATCWAGLLNVVDRVDAEGYFTDTKGAFSTYQKVRNARRKISGGFSDEIKLACSALRSDARAGLFDAFRRVGLPIPSIL